MACHLAGTEEAEDDPHYAACCAGGTLVMNGRLLVTLGEHLAMGLAALAQAVLAHQRSRISSSAAESDDRPKWRRLLAGRP